MTNRKQLIEDILNSFHAMRHKIKPKDFNSTHQNPITHSQWFVLGIIENCKNASIKDISGMLGMSSSGVTQLVDGLVQSGYVVRQDDPKDRRLVQLELSLKGKKQIAILREKRIKKMEKLFDVLTDSELRTYLKLHKKITSKFLDRSKK